MYTRSPEQFSRRQEALNSALAFCGYRLEDNSSIVPTKRTDALEQIRERLIQALKARDAHPDVIKACEVELRDENCFHAVLEAAKSITTMIQEKSHLITDGSDLAEKAFGGSIPLLAINPLVTESHWSEQTGFLSLLKGMYSTFRNPTAHEPKNEWPMSELDALDIFSLIAYLHRRLDNALRNSDNKTRPRSR